MLCLSGFELYSRWVPDCVYDNLLAPAAGPFTHDTPITLELIVCVGKKSSIYISQSFKNSLISFMM